MHTMKLALLVLLSRTPLHYAAATGKYQCILSLVANGANLLIMDSMKRTPLHYAAANDSDGKSVTHSYLYNFLLLVAVFL